MKRQQSVPDHTPTAQLDAHASCNISEDRWNLAEHIGQLPSYAAVLASRQQLVPGHTLAAQWGESRSLQTKPSIIPSYLSVC